MQPLKKSYYFKTVYPELSEAFQKIVFNLKPNVKWAGGTKEPKYFTSSFISLHYEENQWLFRFGSSDEGRGFYDLTTHFDTAVGIVKGLEAPIAITVNGEKVLIKPGEYITYGCTTLDAAAIEKIMAVYDK